MLGRVAACALTVWLAGCATAPPPAPTAPTPAPAPTAPQAAPQAPVLKKETLAYLAKRGLKPISGRALNTQVNCGFVDKETGYAGQLALAVTDAHVERLEARVDIPKRGSCRFNLADFRQIERLPIVVLASQKSSCKVSLWEQGDQVTVAFRDCRAECGGDAVDYLWPILVDNRKGRCS
ncbi:MAG: hypothetical protein ACOY6N_14310 [Pseudomonadota bacterium]|uniref:hypothetical protein n=1 Tax=Sulfuricystis thermophila TaxID=2496847 RepID=UPI0024DF5666|nr:hypothetical protein [Sulfuricystis thermophila]